jgi:hypothetical protein
MTQHFTHLLLMHREPLFEAIFEHLNQKVGYTEAQRVRDISICCCIARWIRW